MPRIVVISVAWAATPRPPVTGPTRGVAAAGAAVVGGTAVNQGGQRPGHGHGGHAGALPRPRAGAAWC